MKKLLITALAVFTASISLVHAGAGGWTDSAAPLYDFSTGGVIKTWYSSSVRSEEATRMGSIQFKTPASVDILQLEAKNVYFVDTKWNKKYINTFREEQNGTYSYVYYITPTLRIATQFNEVVFMTETNCRIYDTLAKQKICDRKAKTQFNILSTRYKSIWIKFSDWTTKEMKFKFSHQDTVKELYDRVNGTGN